MQSRTIHMHVMRLKNDEPLRASYDDSMNAVTLMLLIRAFNAVTLCIYIYNLYVCIKNIYVRIYV
jgi:hypothetical protein